MANKHISTFQAVIVHAENDDCSLDILLSPFVTLNQLSKYLLNAFDINEHNVDSYQFSQKDEFLQIETCFGLITDQQQELDGFLTPIAPGVYIEHSHPHEPLPSFSIYKNNSQQDADMSFRLLRDERHVRLGSCSACMIYEFQYIQLHCYIQLKIKTVRLPIQFSDTITTDPKIIQRKGHLFTKSGWMSKVAMSNKPLRIKTNVVITLEGKALKSSDEMDEKRIKEACKNEIQRLKEERELFILDQQRQQCKWIEPSGDHCAYCTLL